MHFNRGFIYCFFFPLLKNFEILFLLIASPLYILLHPSNKLLCLHIFTNLKLLLLTRCYSNKLWGSRLHIFLLFAERSIERLQLYVIRLGNDLHVLLFLFKCLEPSLFLHLLLLSPLKLLLSLQKRLDLIVMMHIIICLRTYQHPSVCSLAPPSCSLRRSRSLTILIHMIVVVNFENHWVLQWRRQSVALRSTRRSICYLL